VFREYKGLLNEMELVSKIIHSHMDEPLDQELTNTKQTPKMD